MAVLTADVAPLLDATVQSDVSTWLSLVCVDKSARSFPVADSHDGAVFYRTATTAATSIYTRMPRIYISEEVPASPCVIRNTWASCVPAAFCALALWGAPAMCHHRYSLGVPHQTLTHGVSNGNDVERGGDVAQ
ncbi:hypothetical protein DQ04_12531020 [Trypanosoma grayi]|uniref:hypothetical protein n=1 Tax=Trypanosoma grayi TaxID=71804 RepID=UPI0004F42574|nr:hypothetical protein DQ04_12531020 [Trypanosoma grayi]KEG06733.1 hypothetical protein DQ04_12531020 [Trypanosoma grayi]